MLTVKASSSESWLQPTWL